VTNEELDLLIADTKAALEKAIEAIDKLTKIDSEPHKSMVHPTWKIKERLVDDLRELRKMTAAL
jgi:hypothetical protein